MKYKVLKDYVLKDYGMEAITRKRGSTIKEETPIWFTIFLLREGYIERAPEKKGGRIWIPEKNKKYYVVDSTHSPCPISWNESRFDDMNLAVDDVFKTPREAEQYRQKLEALAKIKHYIAENFEPWEPDWKDKSEGKYHIYFNHLNDRFDWQWADHLQRVTLLPYFKTNDEAEEIINKFEEELRIIFEVGKEGK
jgi:hypothetical protein